LVYSSNFVYFYRITGLLSSLSRIKCCTKSQHGAVWCAIKIGQTFEDPEVDEF